MQHLHFKIFIMITDNQNFMSAYNALQKLDADTQLNIANLLLGVFSNMPDVKENEQASMELMELIEAFS